MSWSVHAVGKAAAVGRKIAEQLAASKCVEPEESIKKLVGEQVALALAAFPAHHAVKVQASGSQSTLADGTKTNALSVAIEPMYGFVE